MTNQRDWNYERYRTRDLLLEYDNSIMPVHPQTAGLNIIYHWENIELSILSKQLFKLAAKSGFIGTEEDFNEQFGSYLNNKPIIYSNYLDFPTAGEETKLYFDLDEKILYYWDNQYIPVNAMLIANTIIEGGGA